MRFFTDPSGWTHYGKLFDVPIYARGINTDEPEIVGTNVVYDWLLTWWPQLALIVANWLRVRFGHEPLPGWPIMIYEDDLGPDDGEDKP